MAESFDEVSDSTERGLTEGELRDAMTALGNKSIELRMRVGELRREGEQAHEEEITTLQTEITDTEVEMAELKKRLQSVLARKACDYVDRVHEKQGRRGHL